MNEKNEGNQIHNFISSSGSGTVIKYGSGSGSDFLTSYGSGSGSTCQKVTVPVPQRCFQDISSAKANTSCAKPSFVTKHTAACTFSPPIDEASIPFLGFLPQDMNGDDIFNYIHPLDLPLLKNAFEAAMLEQGKPVSSKLIRFRVRNGGYIQLNSWWSSFINPWSRLLEFIHGKHFVLKGPRYPDVFGEPLKGGGDDEGGAVIGTTAVLGAVDELNEECPTPEAGLPTEEAVKAALLVQTDIRNILRRTVHRNTSTFLDTQPNSSTKTKKELSHFMGNLLEVAKAETTKLGGLSGGGKGGLHGGPHPGVVAHISPHQSDSSETPPSYNQLTYNENLTRFFNSQPKTLSEQEVLEEDTTTEGGRRGEPGDGGSSSQLNKTSKEKNNKHGGGGKRRGGGGGGRGGEDGGQSAQGSRTSGDQGVASGNLQCCGSAFV